MRKNYYKKLVALMATMVLTCQLVGCGDSQTWEKLGVRTRHNAGYSTSTRIFQIDKSYEGMTIEEADPEVISWLCGTYAIQQSVNFLDLTIVGGMERGDEDIDFIKDGLEIGWGIADRKSALETINKLLQDEKVCDSWNSSRAMQLLGQSYAIGYIEFDEYMEYAIPLGKIIQQNYSDWESFGNAYLEGYANWMRGRKNPDEAQITERQVMHKSFVERSKSSNEGPYSVDFDLDLG